MLLFRKILFLGFVVLVCSSCSSTPMIQSQLNNLMASNQYDQAIQTFENREEYYGPQNQFLYLIDYGLVQHFAGNYEESIRAFEKAKSVYEDVQTISVTNQALTWILNDNVAPYRGEDFERAMVNVFQAMNYVMLGDYHEALVDARDVDLQLSMINNDYPLLERNTYKEDAFVRFLMGILYEAVGNRQEMNDAYIEYKKAVQVYEGDFEKHYGVKTPKILKQNFLAAVDFMGEDPEGLKKRFSGVPYLSWPEKQQKAEVYLLHYHGIAPTKYQVSIPVQTTDDYIVHVAFPAFQKHYMSDPKTSLRAKGGGVESEAKGELVQDISEIAMESLSDRRLRTAGKTVIRSAGKYLIARNQEKSVTKEYGDSAGKIYKYVVSAYNIFSEQADLRSWQTLPAQIWMARLVLEPGDYELFANGKSLGQVNLRPGEKKFYSVRTVY